MIGRVARGIGRGAGRSAKAGGRFVGGRKAMSAGMAGAFVAGGVSALNEGAYPDIYEDVMGIRDPAGFAFKAGMSTAYNRGNISGVQDYHNGRQAVPGDLVFGMYNLRR